MDENTLLPSHVVRSAVVLLDTIEYAEMPEVIDQTRMLKLGMEEVLKGEFSLDNKRLAVLAYTLVQFGVIRSLESPSSKNQAIAQGLQGEIADFIRVLKVYDDYKAVLEDFLEKIKNNDDIGLADLIEINGIGEVLHAFARLWNLRPT